VARAISSLDEGQTEATARRVDVHGGVSSERIRKWIDDRDQVRGRMVRSQEVVYNYDRVVYRCSG